MNLKKRGVLIGILQIILVAELSAYAAQATTSCTQSSDCDDGNACTADVCNTGACANTTISCDDGDGCTIDSCDTRFGCQHVANDCPTADACHPQRCVNGTCQVEDNLCNNKNPCTVNLGIPGQYLAIDCTGGSKCVLPDCDRNSLNSNGCLNTAKNCDDHNACSTDTCASATGCSYAALDCDDDDACTADSCDPASGCIHTAACTVTPTTTATRTSTTTPTRTRGPAAARSPTPTVLGCCINRSGLPLVCTAPISRSECLALRGLFIPRTHCGARGLCVK